MSNINAELFIRKHIQKILMENEESTSGQGRVFGSAGRGRLPKEIAEVFGGEDGSAAEPKRLASVNPAKLMKNLNVNRQQGNTTLERAKALIESARNGTSIFGKAIGTGEDREDGDRQGVFFSNAGLPNARLANLFIYDTLRAAAEANYIKMTGHLRVEETAGGVLVYNVRNPTERWAG